MTDHKEEQNNEIEALESIYPDELEGLEIGIWKLMHLFLSIGDVSANYISLLFVKIRQLY
jgi:hypothetical protein